MNRLYYTHYSHDSMLVAISNLIAAVASYNVLD